jgi:flagellar basal-body rod protein FlgG
MASALWTASTGMSAQMTQLDVIANNLANASTIGFKKSRADFQDLLYQTLSASGESTGDSTSDPTGEQVGVGTKLSGITKEFSQGPLERTDRDLDVAINGAGFIEVTGPGGEPVYTRDGAFKIDAQGTVVNSDGYTINGVGAIPVNARSINFGPTGQVSYIDETGSENVIGQLQLAAFVNPSGLNALGGNLYQASDASGDAQLLQPGTGGAGTLQQHFIEKSNVSIVEEMVSLISTQRAYEINSKMIKAADEMLATTNQIA